MPKIDILANTRQAQSEVKDLGKAIEGVSDVLVDIARDGDKSTDKLERSFQTLADEAKDSARTIKREIPDAYQDAGRAADRFEQDATGNVRNFKQEAVQNFSEVASSFDGSVNSMADGVQGLTGGLASALTPGIGIPVAILGAAAAAFFANWVQASEDSEARVAEMYDRLGEYGAAYISRANIAEALGELGQDKVVEGIQRATDLQLEQSDVLRAMVGDTQAISEIYSELADRKRKEVEAIQESGASTEDQATKIDAVNTKYGESTDWLRQIQQDTGTAADAWTAVQEAVRVANGGVSELDGRLRGLPNPNVIVKIGADDSAFQRTWSILQAKAESGIGVKLAPGQGRTWQ